MSEQSPEPAEPEQRVRRRVGTRLALACAGAALALGVIALLVLEPVERATVTRVGVSVAQWRRR